MHMKAFRYCAIPVGFAAALTSNVYANTSDYLRPFGFYVLQSGIYSFFKTVYYLIMFALILAAAYYVTKFLARKGIVQGKTKTMKVIESMPLGIDKSLHIVKVGAQFFLIGSASKNMFMISALDADKLFQNQENEELDLDEIEGYEDSTRAKDFGTYLSSAKQSLNKLKSMVRGSKDNEK